jgi:hypothetical protein
MIERKWRDRWGQGQDENHETVRTCAVLVPSDSATLTLENARLLILADFLASVCYGASSTVVAIGVTERWMKDAANLALSVQDAVCGEHYPIAVVPRDYGDAGDQLRAADILSCGRLLKTGPVSDFLPDFGVDALRIYCLFMGPPERDYVFRWKGLASAYRFVTRVWNYGQNCREDAYHLEALTDLSDLRTQVQTRLKKGKPHTALAAIMGYIKDKTSFTTKEAETMGYLLKPFAPFLSAELLDFVATIQNHNGG